MTEKQKTNIQTPYFRTCSWHALFNLPQALHGGKTILESGNHFSIQHIVFPTGCKMLSK